MYFVAACVYIKQQGWNDMVIPFNAFFRRISEKTDIATQMDLAKALGVNRSAITQAKIRDAVPSKWILALSRQYGISPDWLEFGAESSEVLRNAPPNPIFRPIPDIAIETVMIPKVRAVLCAGGGSLELEAVPVSKHPLPRTWLSRMGSADDMVFMDVIGNSMEPGIRDGDMVLVDQSRKEISQRSVMAVGYEDAIFIKRLEKRIYGLTMLSDNSDYEPVDIRGEEMDLFRIIGKVVWLCRDCRYV